MLTWITENLSSIVVVAIVLFLMGLALRKIIRDKKSGKGTCGGNCSACGGCSHCK